MIEREPITVILSQRGWIRAMKGHVELAGAETLKFKEGDGPRFAFHAQTTDKLLLAAETGRFYTLAADKLPGGRGFGEPVRLMIDLDGEVPIIALLRATEAERLLVAASDGRGFVLKAADAIAETRKGKSVVTPRTGAKLKLVRPIGAGRRLRRGDRRQPQDAGLPARRSRRAGQGAGGAVAALSRRRAGRRRRPSSSPKG